MRTTLDLPEPLMKRVRRVLAERNQTFRALVIDALEQALSRESAPFRLRDASAGYSGEGGGLSSEAINLAIDEQRTLPDRW